MQRVLGYLALYFFSNLFSISVVYAAPATLSEEIKRATAETEGCTYEADTYCWGQWTDRVTVGPGIPAVSFRFDGKIGVLDRVVPLELSLNFWQAQAFDTRKVATKLVWWRSALGLTFSSAPDDVGARFGAYFMPWGMQVNSFAFGVGFAYSAVDKVETKNKNFAVVLPISYQVQF